MKEDKEQIVFDKLLTPVLPLIEKAANNIEGDSETYNLPFISFTTNLLFVIIYGIKSVRMLITQIKTSATAHFMNLACGTKSAYSEAFRRYDSEIYKGIFVQLLATMNFLDIPEIASLGRFMLVDGSLFPVICSMQWASYKKDSNAIKLQFALELNRMLPAHFLITEGNFNEKKFLMSIIEKGVTYICDRGYISFENFKIMCKKEAFFIIRGKEILKYNVIMPLEVAIPGTFEKFIDAVKDMRVIFSNDEHQQEYRIVNFEALGEHYVLITNRFDLSTYEIIMLYAYRWQIELFFRFLKRTLNGIHLMSQNQNGVQIQFYLYMIAYLLLLKFKQECEIINETEKIDSGQLPTPIADKVDSGTLSAQVTGNGIKNEENYPENPKAVRNYACGLVTLLGDRLKKFWKLGIHWLTTVRNLLIAPFTFDKIKIIVSQQ